MWYTYSGNLVVLYEPSASRGTYFLAFFAAGFLAAFGLAAFLAAGFLAFFAAGFLAALGFFAFGFLAFFALGFLAFGFLAFGALAGNLKEPAPFLPAAASGTNFLAASIFLRAKRTRTAALAASTLLLATTYLRMAWREEPFLSASFLMAAVIMAAYGGWAAGAFLAFLALGAAADMMNICLTDGQAVCPH